MSPEFIAAAKAEESDLLKKLEALRALLAAYDMPPAQVEAKPKPKAEKPSAPPAAVRQAKSGSAERAMDKFTPYGRAVVAAAVNVARASPRLPIKTREITEILLENGVEIRGNDPVNALGAMLHRCSSLRSLGKRGWTLADGVTGHPNTAHENGALNGQAASAPEVGEAATSPVENRGWQAYPG